MASPSNTTGSLPMPTSLAAVSATSTVPSETPGTPPTATAQPPAASPSHLSIASSSAPAISPASSTGQRSSMTINIQNIQSTIKSLEARIAQIQSTQPQKGDELPRLQDLLSKARTKHAQLQAAAKASVNMHSTTPPRAANHAIPDVKILDRKRVSELVREVDPMEQLDEDVEEMLMQIADDFIENVVSGSAQLAKHRRAQNIEVKDVQLHLDRHWNMRIPGYAPDERLHKRPVATEAHKQRLALIRKTMKKY